MKYPLRLLDDDINGSSSILSINAAKNYPWYKKLQTTKDRVLWCPSVYLERKTDVLGKASPKILSAVTRLKNPSDFLDSLGYLRVDILESSIYDVILRANTMKASLTYIVNSEGQIVISSKQSLLEKYRLDNSNVSSKSYNNNDWNPSEINNEQVFYRTKTFKDTDWTMVTVIPYTEVVSESRNIRNKLLLIVFIISTLTYAVAYYIADSVTKRISFLIHRMKDVQKGNLDSIIKSTSNDEVGELTENYNYMIHKIQLLVEEQFKSGLEVKNAELKALQAQINPHFLYNIFDMINWLADENLVDDIKTAVRATSKFYKLSLSNGKEVISIKDELLHVQFYVQIQNIRFEDKIKLIINTSDELDQYSILKFTLQPIIENSILHGIRGRASKEGNISINIRLENDEIFILVEDDGIGITSNNLVKILSDKFISKTDSGYGVKNVRDRIKLFYGEHFTVSYESEYGKGTLVRINIPAVKHE